MRKFSSVLLSALFVLAMIAPSSAADRIMVWPNQNPSSTQTNQAPRFLRLGMGTWMRDVLGPTTAAGGTYSGLSVVPQSGLNVVVQPTTANQLGALYQIAQDDVNPMPPSTTPNLPADATQIVVQGLQSATSAALGPLSPPGTSGQSVYWLIEAQVQTTDTTPVSMLFVTGNVRTMNTVNTVRQDQIVYQIKQGTAAVSPQAPNVDAGWIPVAYALVPFGTVTINSGMITAYPPFQGIGTLPATGVATASTSYPSACLSLNESLWDGFKPVKHTWCEQTDNTAFSNLLFNFDGTMEGRVSATGAATFSKLYSMDNLGGGTEHKAASCANGDVCVAESASTGRVWLGGNTSSCSIDYGMTTASFLAAGCVMEFPFNAIVGDATSHSGTVSVENGTGTASAYANLTPSCVAFGAGCSGTVAYYGRTSAQVPVLNQQSAGTWATRHALTAGTYTFTYPSAYANVPVCEATGEGSGTNVLHVTPGTNGCIVTSSSGTDTQTVDIVVVGNPN